MEYDEARVLTKYVWDYFQDLMTDVERRANRVGMAAVKATLAESNGAELLARALRRRWGCEADPDVRAELADGFDVFRTRVARRLLSNTSSPLKINRCPECHRLLRTPEASQCFWCGHAWQGIT